MFTTCQCYTNVGKKYFAMSRPIFSRAANIDSKWLFYGSISIKIPKNFHYYDINVILGPNIPNKLNIGLRIGNISIIIVKRSVFTLLFIIHKYIISKQLLEKYTTNICSSEHIQWQHL